MRSSSSGHAAQAIERVLELSADAQITRRITPKDSPAFHSLTGAIARAEQRVDQEGSSPSGARMRGAISKSGGNSSLAEESRRYAHV
jgi:hypothetical protein